MTTATASRPKAIDFATLTDLLKVKQGKPTEAQEILLRWLLDGEGHSYFHIDPADVLTVLSMIGITLQSAGVQPSGITVNLFAKNEAEALAKKLGTTAWKETIITPHRSGWNLLKQELNLKSPKASYQPAKYKKIAQEFGLISQSEAGTLTAAGAIDLADFLRLIDIARLAESDITPEAIDQLSQDYSIVVHDFTTVAKAIAACLLVGEKQAEDKTALDLIDQLWLPVRWELCDRDWFTPFQFVIFAADDSTDDAEHALALKLASKLVGKTGRLLVLGNAEKVETLEAEMINILAPMPAAQIEDQETDTVNIYSEPEPERESETIPDEVVLAAEAFLDVAGIDLLQEDWGL